MGPGIVGSVPPCLLPRRSCELIAKIYALCVFLLKLLGLVSSVHLTDGSMAFAISLGKFVHGLKPVKLGK